MSESHVNVIDSRLMNPPGLRYWRYTRSQRYLSVDQNWSMDRIARRVLEESPDGIGVLRLMCHGGGMGNLTLGQGLTAATARQFQILHGHFAGQHPRIEVHACGALSTTPVVCPPNITPNQVGSCTPGTIARGGPGHAIMQALADAAGVLVVAPFNAQLVSGTQFTFEGPVQYFRPAQG